MIQPTGRLSDVEISQRILEMAQTGVYRESIFEAFQSMATKKQIRNAIAYAKQFGLHSVSSLRDPELGTYYQVEADKYQSFQAALKAAVPMMVGDDVAAQILASTQTIRAMLAIAGSSAVLCLILGGVCFVTGHLQSGRFAWAIAVSVGVVWLLQHGLTRTLMGKP